MDNGIMPNDDTEDERLAILRCQQGDKQAYESLVNRYMKRAYFIALGLIGSHEGALDLSQEAFVRAFRSLKKFDTSKKFFTWYYKILRNLCFNFLRDQARHAKNFSAIGENNLLVISDETQDVSKSIELEELKSAVWQGLNALDEMEKEIIILKDFQELSYQQIAETLECPIGTVMSRLYYARKSLKQQIVRLMD